MHLQLCQVLPEGRYPRAGAPAHGRERNLRARVLANQIAQISPEEEHTRRKQLGREEVRLGKNDLRTSWSDINERFRRGEKIQVMTNETGKSMKGKWRRS